MATRTSTAIARQGRSDLVAAWGFSPETRQHMIQEAAYYRYMNRGFESGHDLEDWLAAEADIEHATTLARQAAGAVLPEFGRQQGSTFGPGDDEAFKRMIRQHPRRDISRIEGIEPDEAPPKE